MDGNLADARRNKIYDELADLMIDAFSRGDIDLKEAKEMSKTILEKLDNVKLESELYNFIDTLCQKWSIYGKVLIGLKSEKESSESQKKIEELQQKIAHLMK